IRVRSAVEAWNPETGANLAPYTQPLQGLAFLSAPALADVTGEGRPDIILGADSGALHAWDGASGQPLSGWPKWTGGWTLVTAASYDMRVFSQQPTPESFSAGTPLPGAPAPAPAGTQQCATVTNGAPFIGLRAIDPAGNISYPAFVSRRTHH